MGDLISRKALIEQMADVYEYTEPTLSDCTDMVKNAPDAQSEVIMCKDCKYQVKTFCTDKRFTEGGYWEVGCKHFGEIIGYWGWGGQDDQYCSDAERKEIRE